MTNYNFYPERNSKRYLKNRLKSYFTGLIFFVVILLGFFGLAKISNAATINAVSCSQSDVQNAINSAQDGDIVLIPTGNCTWTSSITFCKQIELRGNGESNTIITDNIPKTGWLDNPIYFDGICTKKVIISNFTLKSGPNVKPLGLIFINSNNMTFRIHHMTFDDSGKQEGRAIFVRGKSYGVIDHCTFKTLQIWIGQTNDNSGDTSWTTPMSWGTKDAVYVEDNTFIFTAPADSALDCQDGGRTVWRYNIIDGSNLGAHGFDSVPRSCLFIEAYGNTFQSTLHSQTIFPSALQLRGGTALFYDNNIINTNFTYGAVAVTNYRSCSDGYVGPYPDRITPHWCDGYNSYDQNTSPTSTYYGYACKDQIGRGTNQGSYPFYQWDNTYNGSPVNNITIYDGGGGTCYTSTHIQANRDYYNDTQMPNYTPYTYPHPLRAEADTTPPAAPTGVSVN